MIKCNRHPDSQDSCGDEAFTDYDHCTLKENVAATTAARKYNHKRAYDSISGPHENPFSQSFDSFDRISSDDAVDMSHKFTVKSPRHIFQKREEETDCHRINQRQKQIDFGKDTLGYQRYIELVPREQRRETDPKTPDAKKICSKRKWYGLLQKWRRDLHNFDPPSTQIDSNTETFPNSSIDHSDIIGQEGKSIRTKSHRRPVGTNLLEVYQVWAAQKTLTSK